MKVVDWVLQKTLMISTKWPTRITSIGTQSENNYIDLLKFEFLLYMSLLKIILGKYLAKIKKKAHSHYKSATIRHNSKYNIKQWGRVTKLKLNPLCRILDITEIDS